MFITASHISHIQLDITVFAYTTVTEVTDIHKSHRSHISHVTLLLSQKPGVKQPVSGVEKPGANTLLNSQYLI